MKKRLLFQIISIALILALCVVLVIVKVTGNKSTDSIAAPLQSTNPETLEQKKNSIIEETHDISIEVISDGLKDMGVLVTSEYYFTDVIDYSEAKEFFGIKLPLTESSFIAGYDGVVTAGVNFQNIVASIDNEKRVITITMPNAYVISTELDNDSFVLYSQKDGLGTKIDITEYNSALAELKIKARDNAKDKGLLDRADENAQAIVSNFVEGLVKDFDYKVVVNSIN